MAGGQLTIRYACNSKRKRRTSLGWLKGGISPLQVAARWFTFGRRLTALSLGAKAHDDARRDLVKQAELTSRKVKVQAQRLVAHHDNIARIYSETTVLQGEAAEVVEACQGQLRAIQELRRQIYEAERNVVSFIYEVLFMSCTRCVCSARGKWLFYRRLFK